MTTTHMPVAPARTDPALATALRISVSRLARRLRAQRLSEAGHVETPASQLSETQLAALSVLERRGPLTPGELAEHEKVQPPSMTRVVSVLTEKGLVSRSPHPSDRRQALLAVTKRGRELVREVRRRKEAWLARNLAVLTDDEQDVLRAAVPILEKLSQSA